ncbi:MAG: zf-HC2 domain-containing protein [Gemmatimonadetes bacterium]|nr:zf-HC2 domain-containing protein [Gemmatimonadota bacterium]
MTMHLTEANLNDWADDALPPGERGIVERHLAACPDCHDAAYALKELVGSLRTLPRDIAPPRDLRPGIAARIDHERAGDEAARRGWRERSLWSVRPQLAAAALVLMALSSVTTAWLVRRETGRVPAAMDGMVAEMAAAEAKYRDAAVELEALLRDVRHEMSPATTQLFDQSLATLDRALNETRAALDADPGNPTLTGIMIASYEKKIELLRRATELADG